MSKHHSEFETVYQKHRTAIFHTALSFVRDPAIAEDVTHDVFLSYYEQLQRGTPIRNLKAWLLTVTRNRSCNILRDGKWEYPEENLPETQAEDSTLLLQEEDTINYFLSHLTEDEKLVFSLHYLDGYTYRELALGLQIPIGTVQTRCNTARKKLKKALKDGREANYDIPKVSQSVSTTATGRHPRY